jgi:hypothetical protein
MGKRSVRRAVVGFAAAAAALSGGLAVGTAQPAQASTAPASHAVLTSRAYYTIDWSSFPDLREDRVDLSGCAGNPAVPADSIQLVLESAPNITWWKAIDAHAWDGSRIGWAETNSANHGPSTVTLRVSDVEDVVLAKAGFLNTYKGMYQLDHDQLAAKAGTCNTLRWQRD